MRIFRRLPDRAPRIPSVLAIGKFDGVHRGHQALLARVREIADALDAASTVLTFEPHPRDFFAQLTQPVAAMPRLANLRDTVAWLADAGVERVVVQPFDGRFAALSAQAFIHDVLVDRLNVKTILIGDDFRFGARRQGDCGTLKLAGQRHGFEVLSIDTITSGGARISSSRIRAALAHGDFSQVRALLGRPYSVSGRLVQAKARRIGHGVPALEFVGITPATLPEGSFAVRLRGAVGAPTAATLHVDYQTGPRASRRPRVQFAPFQALHLVAGERVSVEFIEMVRHDVSPSRGHRHTTGPVEALVAIR